MSFLSQLKELKLNLRACLEKVKVLITRTENDDIDYSSGSDSDSSNSDSSDDPPVLNLPPIWIDQQSDNELQVFSRDLH